MCDKKQRILPGSWVTIVEDNSQFLTDFMSSKILKDIACETWHKKFKTKWFWNGHLVTHVDKGNHVFLTCCRNLPSKRSLHPDKSLFEVAGDGFVTKTISIPFTKNLCVFSNDFENTGELTVENEVYASLV